MEPERQELRDEVGSLKGEQGQPKIKFQTVKKSDLDNDQGSEANTNTETDIKSSDFSSLSTEANYSSEKERQQPLKHQKESKKKKREIDRVETLEIEPALLPQDAEFKGYEELVIQDIKIITDHVLFRKAKYYSP